MTKTERADLLKRVVSKLDEAATILSLVEERMLCEQVCELADLIHVEIEEAKNASAACNMFGHARLASYFMREIRAGGRPISSAPWVTSSATNVVLELPPAQRSSTG